MFLVIFTIVITMILDFIVAEYYIKHRRYPHRYTCPYCRSVKKTFKFSSNDWGIMRQIQLDHLDTFHPDRP